MQWIVDNQFNKRNLTLSEKITLQAKVHAEPEREAADRRRSTQNNESGKAVRVNLPTQNTGRVSEQMAKKAGVSEKTYRDAKLAIDKVYLSIDFMGHGKWGDNLSPRTGRPPIDNPKNIEVKIRFDAESNDALLGIVKNMDLHERKLSGKRLKC